MSERINNFERIFALCKGKPPVITAVVHPCDKTSIAGVVDVMKLGLITPVLVGPEAKIRAAAAQAGVSIDGIKLVSTEHSHAAAEAAVAMARKGEVEALMKGSLHTDELLESVVPSDTGLRTGRRITHVFVMDVPAYPKLLLITDAAINIQPDLITKRDICQNAIDLAIMLGIKVPKVAILSAVEVINPKIPGTVEAAALCKMAERGQIIGGLLDGPLAFDNAINREAADIKNIVSQVAGDPDILLVPDLEAGNMLAKQLTYLAGGQAAGVVLGTRVPIVLTSRSDNTAAREVSTAVMCVVAHFKREAVDERAGVRSRGSGGATLMVLRLRLAATLRMSGSKGGGGSIRLGVSSSVLRGSGGGAR